MSNTSTPLQPTFDYTALPPAAADATRQAVIIIRRHVKVAANSIVEIGRQLSAVKAELPHGMWLSWLEVEFGWSDQTARNFINVYAFVKSKTRFEFEPFDLRALYAISAPSTPSAVQDEAIGLAQTGERVTHAAVKGLKAAHEVVEAKAAAALRDAVKVGDVGLSDAAQIARLPKGAQRQIVEDVQGGEPIGAVREKVAGLLAQRRPSAPADETSQRPTPAGKPAEEPQRPFDAAASKTNTCWDFGEMAEEPPLPLDAATPAAEILPPVSDEVLTEEEIARRAHNEAVRRDPIGMFLNGIYGSQENFRLSSALSGALDMRFIKFVPEEMVAALPQDDVADYLERARKLQAFVNRVIELLEERGNV